VADCGGDGVRHLKDRRRRAIVVVQGDSREVAEVTLGIEQEPCGRAAKPVDGLRVIADDGQPSIDPSQADKHVELEEVHVLELVNQDVVVVRAELSTQSLILCRHSPEQEQVVEVQQSE